MTNNAAASKKPAIASNFALGFLVLCLVVYILHVGAPIMIPFAIAVCVWYLINAMARGLSRISIEKMHLPRFFCFLFSILLLVAGIWFIFEIISDNVAKVAAAAPQYQKHLEQILPKVMALLHLEQEAVVRELMQYLNLGAMIAIFAKMLTGIAGKTLVVLFYTGFLLYEQRFFHRKITEMIENPKTEKHVLGILKNIDVKMQRYIGVKVFVSVLTGLATYLTLRFTQVDFNEFWGLMAFVLNFIPYVGSVVAILMPSLIALIQFGDPSVFLAVLFSLSVIQILLGSILDPRLLGDSLNISPIMIIFALAAWGMIWGIPGMFLSVPILVMIVIILSQLENTRPIAVLLTKTGDISDIGEKKK